MLLPCASSLPLIRTDLQQYKTPVFLSRKDFSLSMRTSLAKIKTAFLPPNSILGAPEYWSDGVLELLGCGFVLLFFQSEIRNYQHSITPRLQIM